MTKEKALILKITESIIENTENLRKRRIKEIYGDICVISEMLDKLEDYLMDYKNYKTNFKEEIRHIRYLLWTIPAVGVDSKMYFVKKVIRYTEILKDELCFWSFKN